MVTRKRYNVVFYGEIAEGYSVEEVRQNLSLRFNLDTEKREELFAGYPVITRENVDYQESSRVETTCELSGAVCHSELVRIDTEAGSIDVTKLCNVEFCGEIAIGHNIEEVKEKLATSFKMDRQTINRLFTGKPVMIKEEVDYQTALNIQATFHRAGAICRIKPGKKSISPEKAQEEKIFLPTNLNEMICPNCGFKQKISPTCMKCGIVVQKYVKKQKDEVEVEEPQETYEEPRHEYDEYGEEPEEDRGYSDKSTTVEEELEAKQVPKWQICLVGTLMVTLVCSLLGVSLQRLVLPFKLSFLHEVTLPKGFFPLFIKNLQISVLLSFIFLFILFLWEQGRDFKILRSIMILWGIVPLLAAILMGNQLIIVFLVLIYTMAGFSAIIYLIGFLCFLIVRQLSNKR